MTKKRIKGFLFKAEVEEIDDNKFAVRLDNKTYIAKWTGYNWELIGSIKPEYSHLILELVKFATV